MHIRRKVGDKLGTLNVGRSQLLDPNCLQILLAVCREIERERESLHGACTQIFCFILAWFLRILKHIRLGQSINLVTVRTQSYPAHRLLYDKVGQSIFSIILIACKTFKIDLTFSPEFHSGLIWIQTVCKCKRERERDCCMHILSGKSKKTMHRQIDK